MKRSLVIGGILFAVIIGAIGSFIAYEYWEANEIRNNLMYRNTATCAPNNILLSEDVKVKLCKAAQSQAMLSELKQAILGYFTN
jgi:hypothetical protein